MPFTHPRRRALLGLAALAPLAPRGALAQAAAQPATTWPNGPVRFLQGFAAGGATDLVARLMAPLLAARLGRPVVVENRPGAGGTLAAEALARATDGHTIMLLNNGFAVSAALLQRLPYDPMTEVDPVAMVASVGLVLLGATSPGAPRDLGELAARARAAPEQLAVATVGVGSTQHLAASAVQVAGGFRLLHVPYRSTSAALVALRNGEVNLVVEPASAVLGQIQGGEARALAVTSRRRLAVLPEVPTVDEALGREAVDIETWYAVGTPAAMPPGATARLVEAVGAALADPAFAARLTEMGLAPRPSPDPAAVRAYVRGEIGRWAEVIRTAGIERQ